MVVTQSLVIDTGIAAARARLHRLVRGSPAGGSRGGREGTGTHRIRLGPSGDAPGASALVSVRFVGPVRREAVTTVWLRVQPTGPEGDVFPALDGDLRVTAEGLEQTRLTLNASYRPPPGVSDASTDRAVTHHSASATIRALLHSIAAALDEREPGAAHHAADPHDPRRARGLTPV